MFEEDMIIIVRVRVSFFTLTKYINGFSRYWACLNTTYINFSENQTHARACIYIYICINIYISMPIQTTLLTDCFYLFFLPFPFCFRSFVWQPYFRISWGTMSICSPPCSFLFTSLIWELYFIMHETGSNKTVIVASENIHLVLVFSCSRDQY